MKNICKLPERRRQDTVENERMSEYQYYEFKAISSLSPM